jgi:hypothetical protein
MRKFNPRYLYTAVATAAITAAVIAIPSWAASGGGDSTAQAPSSDAAPAPPPVAYGLTRADAPSAAEVKQNREKVDEFTTCLKDHGVDALDRGSLSQPPEPPSKSEMDQITKDCGTPPAPPAGLLPPLPGKHADQAGRGECPPLPLPPLRSSGDSGSGS